MRTSKNLGKFTVNLEARRHIATWCLSLGLSIGNNSKLYGKFSNFFIEGDFLLWRFAIEIRWRIKCPVPKRFCFNGCPDLRDAGFCLVKQGVPGAGGSFGDWCECECHERYK